jgi:hypothetical protein
MLAIGYGTDCLASLQEQTQLLHRHGSQVCQGSLDYVGPLQDLWALLPKHTTQLND